MKKRICALLLAAVLVYMPYALAAGDSDAAEPSGGAGDGVGGL